MCNATAKVHLIDVIDVIDQIDVIDLIDVIDQMDVIDPIDVIDVLDFGAFSLEEYHTRSETDCYKKNVYTEE